MYLGQNIKVLRKTENLNQNQFAEVLGVKPNTISGYETGKSRPTFEVFLKIADYFGVSLDDLVYRDMEKEGPGELKSPGAVDREGLREEIKDLLRQMRDAGEL